MMHLTAWGFYALHQIALWSPIYYAQTRVQKYAAGLQHNRSCAPKLCGKPH
ncbi:hypothetical protein GW781_10060 [bacterium]|nr:hypothetical protein [bacterium]NCT21485.1 hypothetical protein [bacterium]